MSTCVISHTESTLNFIVLGSCAFVFLLTPIVGRVIRLTVFLRIRGAYELIADY